MTEWHRKNMAWLLSTVQKGNGNVEFLSIFADEFHEENLLRPKLWWVAKLSARFELALAKNFVFWSDVL